MSFQNPAIPTIEDLTRHKPRSSALAGVRLIARGDDGNAPGAQNRDSPHRGPGSTR